MKRFPWRWLLVGILVLAAVAIFYVDRQPAPRWDKIA
jgi:hypothetical protein